MPDESIPQDTMDACTTRPGVVIGATLYLMTAYLRQPSDRTALCIARHLACLAGHTGADPVVRDVCAAMCREWDSVSKQGTPAANACPARGRTSMH